MNNYDIQYKIVFNCHIFVLSNKLRFDTKSYLCFENLWS